MSNRSTTLPSDEDEAQAARALRWSAVILGVAFVGIVEGFTLAFAPAVRAEAERQAQVHQRPADVADTPWRLGPYRRVTVIDGDTIDTPTNSGLVRIIRVRLLGIDTPEANSTCPEEKAMAQEAADFLRRLTAEPVAVVTGLDFDRYGRALGKLFDREGKDIGQRLIDGGYAVAYAGGARQDWCEIAKRRALRP